MWSTVLSVKRERVRDDCVLGVCGGIRYQTGVGMTAGADCSLCGAGQYATGMGLVLEGQCALCGAGIYQTGEGMGRVPDGRGGAARGTYQTDEGTGTYQTGAGAPAGASCALCGAGTF